MIKTKRSHIRSVPHIPQAISFEDFTVLSTVSCQKIIVLFVFSVHSNVSLDSYQYLIYVDFFCVFSSLYIPSDVCVQCRTVVLLYNIVFRYINMKMLSLPSQFVDTSWHTAAAKEKWVVNVPSLCCNPSRVLLHWIFCLTSQPKLGPVWQWHLVTVVEILVSTIFPLFFLNYYYLLLYYSTVLYVLFLMFYDNALSLIKTPAVCIWRAMSLDLQLDLAGWVQSSHVLIDVDIIIKCNRVFWAKIWRHGNHLACRCKFFFTI